jgi:hypothetical protein
LDRDIRIHRWSARRASGNLREAAKQTAKATGGKYGNRRKLMIICSAIAMFFVGFFPTGELTASL